MKRRKTRLHPGKEFMRIVHAMHDHDTALPSYDDTGYNLRSDPKMFHENDVTIRKRRKNDTMIDTELIQHMR